MADSYFAYLQQYQLCGGCGGWKGGFRERSRPWGAIQPRRLGTDAPARSDDTLRGMPHEVRSASTGMVAHLGAIPGRGPSVFPLVPAVCQGSAPTPRTPEERVP